MEDAAFGPAVTVELALPVPSWWEARCLGGAESGIFWIGDGREGNGLVDLVRVSRVCSGFLNTERIASYLFFKRVEKRDPAEKYRRLATDVVGEVGTLEAQTRRE